MNWRLYTIIKRKGLERNFEMAIHGAKPADGSGESNEIAEDKLPQEQKEAMAIAREKAKLRKAEEFRLRMNG